MGSLKQFQQIWSSRSASYNIHINEQRTLYIEDDNSNNLYFFEALNINIFKLQNKYYFD